MPRPDLHTALRLYGQGRLAEARDLCHTLLETGAADPIDTRLLLGEIHLARQEAETARRLLAEAHAHRPDDPQLNRALGEAWLACGQPQRALPLLQRATRHAPDDPLAWYALGCAFDRLQRPDEALAAWQRALQADPDHRPSRAAVARHHLARGAHDIAAAHYRHLLRLDPEEPAWATGLATALEAQGDFHAALEVLWPLRHLAGEHPELANDLGLMHHHLGHHDAAEGWYRLALARRPQSPEIRWNLALCLLRQGRYREGWPLFEARWGLPQFRPLRPTFPQPQWRGEPLHGRTLLLHAEQGLGDTLQFIRLARHAKARGGRLILQCQPALVPLLETLPELDQVLPRGQALPPFQVHCPLMSLPLALGLTLRDLPAAPIPYLRPDPRRVARWRPRLPADGRPHVGLVWAGNPRRHDPQAHAVDRRRSLPFEALQPLLADRRIAWVSLQRDDAEAAARDTLARRGVHNLGPELADFADTAAVVAQLDLVIAVDTAIVHLAGALGRPVWLLSRFDTCWRWLWGRDDSPWYPSLRLYRQPQPGHWRAVLTRVRRDLERLLEGTRPPPLGQAGESGRQKL